MNYIWDKFDSFEYNKQLKKQIAEFAINKLKNDYEKLDKKIKNSEERKNNGWYVWEVRKRSILTEFGNVEFNRTIYKNKYTNAKKALLDSYVDIQRYQKISLSLKHKILSLINGGERQKDILKMIQLVYIDRSTISRILSNVNFEEIYNNIEDVNSFRKNIDIKEIGKKIWIDVDDTFINLKYKRMVKKVKIRIASVRFFYKGKMIKKIFIKNYLNVSTSTKKFCKWLEQKIINYVGEIFNKEIIVGGDGANWIKKVKEYFCAKLVLDKYHFIRDFRKTFRFLIKNDKSKYLQKYLYLKKLLDKKQIHLFYKYLKIIYLVSNKDEQLEKFLKYVGNNLEGIKNLNSNYYIGVTAESCVSHYIKSIRGYGAKIFSLKTFLNLIFIKLSKVNDIPLVNDWLENEKQKIEEKNNKTSKIIKKFLWNFKSINSIQKNKMF